MEQERFLRDVMAAHGDMVYRLALCRMQNVQDAEDVYQDVFLRLLQEPDRDWDGEHLKAWLIRTALNRCADLHRFRLRRPVLPLEAVPELAGETDRQAAELWEAVGRLPEKWCISTTPRATARRRPPGCWASPRPRSAPGSAGPV